MVALSWGCAVIHAQEPLPTIPVPTPTPTATPTYIDVSVVVLASQYSAAPGDEVWVRADVTNVDLLAVKVGTTRLRATDTEGFFNTLTEAKPGPKVPCTEEAVERLFEFHFKRLPTFEEALRYAKQLRLFGCEIVLDPKETWTLGPTSFVWQGSTRVRACTAAQGAVKGAAEVSLENNCAEVVIGPHPTATPTPSPTSTPLPRDGEGAGGLVMD